MAPLSNLAVRDIETVIHPYTNLQRHREMGPLVLEEGRGIYVFDSDGKRYIEGLAGLWCTALGYGNRELVDAATRQMQRLPFTHLFGHKSNDLAIELSEKLKELVPCEASKILFCSSGSEANDMQVKLTWYYNNALGRHKKKKIISRIKGYHGVTIASGSLTGLPSVHTDFDLPIKNILHTSCPHYYRFAEPGESEEQFSERMVRDLEEMILREGPDTVAAFIAEPVMGAGGVILPPKGYFARIEALLARYDIRFIADEVICGFGRTGDWFGTADLQARTGFDRHLAKAITSAYFPLGASASRRISTKRCSSKSKKIGTFGHGYTYTAHPVASAVALKTSRSTSATGSSTTCARWRRPSSRALPGLPTIRWSARCAASA